MLEKLLGLKKKKGVVGEIPQEEKAEESRCPFVSVAILSLSLWNPHAAPWGRGGGGSVEWLLSCCWCFVDYYTLRHY